MNLNELAKQARELAIKRGKISEQVSGITAFKKSSVTQDLRAEIDEFESSELAMYCFSDLHTIMNVDNYVSDKEFVKIYEKNFKNKTGDELADIILVALTAASILNLDIELDIRAKMKYNSLRKD